MSSSRTLAGSRVSYAVRTLPQARGSGAGTNTLPTPPGPLVDLVSTGAAPGAVAWASAIADTAGTYALTTNAGVTLREANTTGGSVNYQLPLAALVPAGGSIETFLQVSPGANPMTVFPTGADQLMNPDTGVYQGTTWSTAPSGNQQGRGVRWVSDGISKWAAH